MNFGLNFLYAREVESTFEAASRRGYLASAQVVAESDRRRGRVARLALAVGGGAVVAGLVDRGVVLPGVFSACAVVLVLVYLSRSADRQAALDRMVELEPFAVPGVASAVEGAAIRRSQQVRSERRRRRLAGSVLELARLPSHQARMASPGAAALRRDPRLAREIASRLMSDGEDARLPLAVDRLLSAGGPPAEPLDRVRRLLAPS